MAWAVQNEQFAGLGVRLLAPDEPPPGPLLTLGIDFPYQRMIVKAAHDPRVPELCQPDGKLAVVLFREAMQVAITGAGERRIAIILKDDPCKQSSSDFPGPDRRPELRFALVEATHLATTSTRARPIQYQQKTIQR